jgi:hypothetical protein
MKPYANTVPFSHLFKNLLPLKEKSITAYEKTPTTASLLYNCLDNGV